MLFKYSIYLCNGIFWLTLVIFACAGYAYLANARRPVDDPNKRDFHPAAVFLAPIAWPLFLLGSISLFLIKALLYGVFIILFAIALVAIRKPFIFVWLDKIATYVGNRLLEANTLLIKLALGQPVKNPQAI